MRRLASLAISRCETRFTCLGNSIPDGERFFQETRVPVLIWEGKCLRRRAKPAHFGRHLPLAYQSVEKCPSDVRRGKSHRRELKPLLKGDCKGSPLLYTGFASRFVVE